MPRLSLGSENSASNNYSKRQLSHDRNDPDDRSPEKRRRSDTTQNNSEPETWVDVFMGSLNKKMTGKRLEKLLLNENMRITEIQWLAYKFKKSAGGCQARVVFENNNDAQKCIRRWHKKPFGWNEDYPVCVSQYRANNSVEVRSTYSAELKITQRPKSNQNLPVYERKSQEKDSVNQAETGDNINPKSLQRTITSTTVSRTIYTPVNHDVKSVDNSPERDVELQRTSEVVAAGAMPSDLSAETRAVAKKIKIENQEFNKRIIKQKDAVIKMKDDTIDMKAKIINSKNTVIKKKDAQLADSKLVIEERDQIQSKFELQQTKFDQKQIEIDRLQKENRDLKLAQLSELKACHEEITEQQETNTNLRAEVKSLSDEVGLLKSKSHEMKTDETVKNKTLTIQNKTLKQQNKDLVEQEKKAVNQNELLLEQQMSLIEELRVSTSKIKALGELVNATKESSKRNDTQKEEKVSNKSIVKQESGVSKSKSEHDDTLELLRTENNKMAQQVKFLAKTNSDMNSENIQKCMKYTCEISGLEQSVEKKQTRIVELEAEVDSVKSDLDSAKEEIKRIDSLEEDFIEQRRQMIESEEKQKDLAVKLKTSEEKCSKLNNTNSQIETHFQKEKLRIEENYEIKKQAAVEHVLGTMSALIASHKPNKS